MDSRREYWRVWYTFFFFINLTLSCDVYWLSIFILVLLRKDERLILFGFWTFLHFWEIWLDLKNLTFEMIRLHRYLIYSHKESRKNTRAFDSWCRSLGILLIRTSSYHFNGFQVSKGFGMFQLCTHHHSPYHCKNYFRFKFTSPFLNTLNFHFILIKISIISHSLKKNLVKSLKNCTKLSLTERSSSL